MGALRKALQEEDEEESLHILLKVPRKRDYVEWKEFFNPLFVFAIICFL